MDPQAAGTSLSESLAQEKTLKRPDLDDKSDVEDTPRVKRVKLDDKAAAEDPSESNVAGRSKPEEGQRHPGRKQASAQQATKKGRTGKGKRRGTRPEGEHAPEEGEPKAPRLPKRQCALLLGFCGAGYNGMQIQPATAEGIRTIEGVLFDALVKAGAVSQDNADDPVKVNLGRAARTDAGVHAAGNLVSLKLIPSVPGVPDLVARINEELPPEIRLWNFVRVQNSFNARSTCDSRKYTYLFPSYLLIPPKPGSGLDRTFQQQSSAPVESNHPFWREAGTDSAHEEDLKRKRQWRVNSEAVQSLRNIAAKFEGSHNFHNFTVGRDFGDRSTQRFMKKIEIADPVVYGDTEWISVLFHGQSFMLHQRKMMCALVLACRTGTPAEIMDEVCGIYQTNDILTPCLLLEYPIFESYNRKMASINAKLDPTHADYRPQIDFEVHRAEIDRFKQEHIYSRMRSIEDQAGIFDSWVRSIDSYAGNDLLYFNPKGIIPANAVIKTGERRSNPFREKKRFDVTTFPEGGMPPAEGEAEEDEEEERTFDKAKLADMEG